MRKTFENIFSSNFFNKQTTSPNIELAKIAISLNEIEMAKSLLEDKEGLTQLLLEEGKYDEAIESSNECSIFIKDKIEYLVKNQSSPVSISSSEKLAKEDYLCLLSLQAGLKKYQREDSSKQIIDQK